MQQDGLMNSNHADRDGSPQRRNPVFTTLVVDGNLSFSGFLKEFFETEGHFIVRAVSAAEALARTREYLPDLILLNNELGGLGGLDLLTDLMMELPSASVIMMAGHPSIGEAVEAMKLGAVDYLERPLDSRRLKQAIDTQKALFTPQ